MKDNGFINGQICNILGISGRSLQHWQNNILDHGDVLPPPNPIQGRPLSLNAMQISDLIDLVITSPEMFLDEIHDYILLAQDISLAPSSIHRLLQDLGFTYKYLRKVAAERDENARRLWKEEIRTTYVAEQMVFVDESSKDEQVIFHKFG